MDYQEEVVALLRQIVGNQEKAFARGRRNMLVINVMSGVLLVAIIIMLYFTYRPTL